LNKRLASVIILLPVALALIIIGGWPFYIGIAVIIGIGAKEFSWLFHHSHQYDPSNLLIISGAILLILSRAIWGFAGSESILTLLTLAAMTIHIIHRERGNENAVIDFCITTAGIFYVGWLGAYIISLRALPDGEWWLILSLGAVWFADAGAFFIGTQFGKHPLAPAISPKKSWEGFIGGAIAATILTPLVALVMQNFAPAITILNGLILGIVLGTLAPLGDLGISMIKRYFKVKDSGTLIPGHGGALDRLDSILWAVALSYQLITWFF
jgi:phosphatidate cytidylyltransferase